MALVEAAFTSPSGVRHTFDFEDVSREGDARGTMHEFPSVKGGYGQRMNEGPRRLPVTAFFAGRNYDARADAFFEAVLEDGIGRLEHPRYGSCDVVVLGMVSQRDDLKTTSNQSVVEVTFWKTTGAIYPSTGLDLPNLMALSLSNFNAAAALNFSKVMKLKSVVARARMAVSGGGILATIRGGLREVVGTSRSISSTFNSGNSAILGGMDLLLGSPLRLGNLLLQMIQAPGRAIGRITGRLEAYADTAQTLIDRFSKLGASNGGAIELEQIAAANDYHTTDLVVQGCVSGSAVACANHEFSTRAEAIAAAAALVEQLDQAVAWRDVRGAEIGEIDTGESYQALQELVALTSSYLVQLSFTLLPERSIVTDRARTIIDLCAELYGEVDGKLDFLISSNKLAGTEIIEIPAGRRIVYYV